MSDFVWRFVSVVAVSVELMLCRLLCWRVCLLLGLF